MSAMNRPRLPRPPSVLSNSRQPSSTSSRPPSRASSNPSPNADRQATTKRPQTAVAKATEQNTAANASSGTSGSSETNIQVVVRCRDRNKREIEENSGVIVAPSRDGHSITVQTSALTELNNKTYAFDRVFGGGAGQQELFDDTVEPIVQEMLGGYNCTIFAYGQTGTGKTYTMSGDMSDHCGGLPPTTAGIIPRALARIFQLLDGAGDEYSIKCSFIELYNEELRDLLAIQEDQKVKIFDDQTKKGGIIISGMEEIAVNSATHGVKILRDGSRKREVAATKCNEVSSRSHSVFTITVHIKQTSTEGEDMLRVGKLNLVDLAGSENVGRSGAENKRAREAGMINQSLLTLGRVINALVDRSQHIPYRESKLTRLLQDSLGGRTKTCIIATLSPAKINMEETVSTLEYANRAKSIKNKPQVNQMMTKKALIKDYILEIERLKGDLNSTRTKNGVYMTEESHTELVNQNESNKVLTEEQQRRIDAMDLQIQGVTAQLEYTMAELNRTKRNLDETSKTLSTTETKLGETESCLAATESSLKNEIILRKAHEASEAELDVVAKALKSTLQDTVGDINSLHAKIDRKRDVEKMNSSSWINTNQDIATLAKEINGTMHDFTKKQALLTKGVSTVLSEFVEKQAQLLSQDAQHLDAQIAKFGNCHGQMDSSLSGARKEVDEVLQEIKAVRESVKSRLGSGLESLKLSAQRIAEEIAGQIGDFQVNMHESYVDLASDFKKVFKHTKEHVESQSTEIRALKADLEAACARNAALIAATAQQMAEANEQNNRVALEEEKAAIAQIQEMLQKVSLDRVARGQRTMQSFSNEMQAAMIEVQTQDQRNTTGLELRISANDVFMEAIVKDETKVKRSIGQGWENAKQRTDTMKQSTDSIHAETVQLVDAALRDVHSQTEALEDFVKSAKDLNEKHLERHNTVLSDMVTHARNTQQLLQQRLSESNAANRTHGESIAAAVSEQKSEVADLSTRISSQAASIKQKSQTTMQPDVPTQTTPSKKKQYTYPESWQTTRSHAELLSEPQTASVATPETETTERSPLADVDVNTTVPAAAGVVLGAVEDELAIPIGKQQTQQQPQQASLLPGPRARGSGEKEIVKPATITSGGQENGAPRPFKRKRAFGQA